MRRFCACLVALCLGSTALHAQDVDQGRALYRTHCASCHGLAADGQGPLAGALIQKPVDLAGLAASNGGDFPLQRVLKRIDGTDPLVSHGSPMPVFGPYFEGVANSPMKLDSGQPVLVAQPIADLVAYLMTVQER